MAVTIALIAKLRRMIAEPTFTTYTDDDLEDVIEEHAVLDSEGYAPESDDWTATYDLNAAAAELWEEKATAFVGLYDFNADGGSFNRSQAYNQAMKMARHYHSRKRVGTISLRPEPYYTLETDDDDSN
jgi:glutamine synthetase